MYTKNVIIWAFGASIFLMGCANKNKDLNNPPLKMIEMVDFSHVNITDSFWKPRLGKLSTTTLPVCIDQIENQTGRIQNFENASSKTGKHSGIYFDDSDVYKALEGIAYTLVIHPNAELEKKADEWIDKIVDAQQPDGYINTFYTLTNLDDRWTDMGKHEMYCAGHLLEAGVAYYQATGKKKLLDCGTRMVEHIMSLFGPGKRHWVTGHEEIELALVRLYEVTKNTDYLDFANWLIEERGHGYGQWGDNKEYCQDDKPVREMTDIAGHAVRAMYLYCGMADVAALKRDTGYIAALHRLWDDVVLRNMYITGGIGSSKHNEGFTEDYDLPNLEAYCETCASVGMVLWNQRMNQLTGDSKYVNVLERAMYNGALAGISLAGDLFFYVNPLESHGNHHRQAWYGCACCPSQLSRFLPSIGNYIYGLSENAIWVNLFIGNDTNIEINGMPVNIHMKTVYPWNNTVKIRIDADSPLNKELRIRIPDWCKEHSITVNGEKVNAILDKGYAVLTNWEPGEEVILSLDMDIEMVSADPQVNEDIGKRAVQRGPLVYCLEEANNTPKLKGLSLSANTTFDCTFDKNFLDGVMVIKAKNDNCEMTFIPYYAWDNQKAGYMKVWIDYNN